MVVSSPRAPSRFGRDRVVLWHHLDVGLVAIVTVIAALGVLVVYSATRGPANELQPADTSFLVRQVLFVIVGLVMMTLAAAVDFRRIRALVPLAYFGLVLALMAVLVVAPEINGIRAWFDLGPFRVQPSEFGKVVVIVGLASWFSLTHDVTLRRLLGGLGLVAVPMALIYLQPDLGTILVYVAITAGIILISGVKPRHLALVLAGLAVVVVLAFASNQLETYQISRLTTFLDDTPETQGEIEARYNVEQAQIAIGNGGVTGTGLFEGTHTRSELVPEQQTDFIFTVVAEELGFVGGATLLFLFALLLARIWRIAQLAAEPFGALICMGVFSMLLFHIFQSVGMTLGMMPVTGIPLPFVSYGGSSMLTMFIAVGLVLNVNMRRFA